MSCDYFCIFAGGGVRGAAYLGVIKALDELNINITGMAGSSVGAVFSSLYSVGYTKDEIKDIVFGINFQTFQDLYIPFGKDFGLCKGDNITKWLREHIEKRFYGEKYDKKGNPPVRFKDIDKDLIVITTDICNTKFKEFSKYKTPEVEIVQAVRASISVPGFFKPVWEKDACLVDGELIKNFPLWYFSKSFLPDDRRILEFRLESSRGTSEIKSPFDFVNALIDTSYNISTDYLIDNYSYNDKYDIIKINTDEIKTIDFNIQTKEKEILLKNGYDNTIKYFKYDIVEKKKDLLSTYNELFTQLENFNKAVKRIRTKHAQIAFGNLFIFLADNKRKIHDSIYSEIENLKKTYQNNLVSIDLLNMNILKDRKELSDKVGKIQKKVQLRIEELKKYI